MQDGNGGLFRWLWMKSIAVQKARVDAFERGLQSKKELADRNLGLDISLLRSCRTSPERKRFSP
jgi:hypothetical protein